MDIDSVCLSYRHDFGLLPESDKHWIRVVAESWLHAFEKHGFGYLGDAEAKQPAQPGELRIMGRTVVHGYLQCQDRNPGDTTAMVGQEDIVTCPRCLHATIADLETRLENAVEIPHESKWPSYADHVWVVYTRTDHAALLYDQDTIAAIPRPTPAKLNPEQMAEAWMLDQGYDIDSPIGRAAGENALMYAMLHGKSIETLYAEIKGGE